MESEQAIVPIREQAVNFYGDALLATQVADGTIYVPVRPIAEHLGLAWPGQFERLKRDPVLSAELRIVQVTRTTETGGVPDMTALPLKLLPGWLFGVQLSRVRPELREKILRYQRDCYEVLWNAFRSDIVPNPPPSSLTGAALAVENARAILHLAEQQLELERRHSAMADYMRGFVRDTKARLGALELQVGGAATISEEQAAEVALAVKLVAGALASDGANHYGEVYTALYRRFGVASYKNIPRSEYDAVVAWLRAWHEDIARKGSTDPGATGAPTESE